MYNKYYSPMTAAIAAIMRLIVLYLALGIAVFKGSLKRFQFVMAKSVLVGNSPACGSSLKKAGLLHFYISKYTDYF